MTPHSFRRWFPAIYAYVAIAGLIVFFTPFSSDIVELVVCAVGSSCLLAMVPFLICYQLAFMWRNKEPDRDANKAILILCIFTVSVAVFPTFMRGIQAELLRTELNGTIVRTYRGLNHGAPSIEVISADGIKNSFEGVTRDVWSSLNPGDTVVKEAWSPYADVNGERRRIVPKAPLDAVRGMK